MEKGERVRGGDRVKGERRRERQSTGLKDGERNDRVNFFF